MGPNKFLFPFEEGSCRSRSFWEVTTKPNGCEELSTVASIEPVLRVALLIRENYVMSLGTILVIILILVLLGVIPTWPHSSGWGYGPSGIVGVILVILLILVLLGRI
jgi:hypothetical protein